MERVTYEDALLMHFKKYLQKLEKLTSGISKGQRKTSVEYRKMAEIAASCLCELLLARPYFNFSQNIAQLLVYLSNCNVTTIRLNVMKCFQQLFREDQKFELTLFVRKFLKFYSHHSYKLKYMFFKLPGCPTSEPSYQIQIEPGPRGGAKMLNHIANQDHQFG